MKKYLFIVLVALGAACISSEDPEPITLQGSALEDAMPESDTTWFRTDTTKLGDRFNIMLVDYLGYADSAYYDPGPYELDSVHSIAAHYFQGHIADDQEEYIRILSINWSDSTWKGTRWDSKMYYHVVLDSGNLIIEK